MSLGSDSAPSASGPFDFLIFLSKKSNLTPTGGASATAKSSRETQWQSSWPATYWHRQALP
jgi:hypothetical protein